MGICLIEAMRHIARYRPIRNPRLLLLAAVAIAGCAPRDFRAGVPWTVQSHRSSDAGTQAVTEMPYLRVNEYLLDRLQSVAKSPGPDGPERLRALVQECHALALNSSRAEIDRLPPDAVDQMWNRYCSDAPATPDRRVAIEQRYTQLLQDEYASYERGLAGVKTGPEAARFAQTICDRAAPSVAQQRGSGPLLESVRKQHEVTPDSSDTGGPVAVIYEPGNATIDAARLARFAPILVQERVDAPRYPARDDEIGAIKLEGSHARIRVLVQTDQPTLYAYERRTMIHGREFPQLVYCWWFPERPPMQPLDPEAGPVDGSTLRITLDSHGQPAVAEVIENCGCYYLCLVSEQIEQRARQEYSAPQTGPAQGPVAGRFVPPAESGRRPIVFSHAGTHRVTSVKFDPRVLESKTARARQRYALRSYDELENMPTGSGRASMFGTDGLVHNAGRLEGWWLAPTGMRSAGQPRQRGTQLICWDKQSFDDPHLLEKNLRLPSDF